MVLVGRDTRRGENYKNLSRGKDDLSPTFFCLESRTCKIVGTRGLETTKKIPIYTLSLYDMNIPIKITIDTVLIVYNYKSLINNKLNK